MAHEGSSRDPTRGHPGRGSNFLLTAAGVVAVALLAAVVWLAWPPAPANRVTLVSVTWRSPRSVDLVLRLDRTDGLPVRGSAAVQDLVAWPHLDVGTCSSTPTLPGARSLSAQVRAVFTEPPTRPMPLRVEIREGSSWWERHWRSLTRTRRRWGPPPKVVVTRNILIPLSGTAPAPVTEASTRLRH